mmetsp:Transcript_3959/g.7601  ORF Transcript_3959/g.7601 Transcript_3959/m.7601 type:complete len:88 (+) Transcript_3959:661-924(+)
MITSVIGILGGQQSRMPKGMTRNPGFHPMKSNATQVFGDRGNTLPILTQTPILLRLQDSDSVFLRHPQHHLSTPHIRLGSITCRHQC